MCWEFMFSLGCRAAGRGDAPPGQGQTGGCLPVRVGAGDASPSKGKVRGRPPEQGAGGDDSPCGAGQKGIPPRTGVGKGKAPRPQNVPERPWARRRRRRWTISAACTRHRTRIRLFVSRETLFLSRETFVLSREVIWVQGCRCRRAFRFPSSPV